MARPTRTFDHYELLLDEKGEYLTLGSGGMGSTFKARHTRLDTFHAVKVMNLGWRAARTIQLRFLHEAKIAAHLNHPNVVRVVHVSGPDDAECFYVMEFIDGISLQERLDRSGPLPVCEALELLRSVAVALTALAEQGLVHRDIKPANLMLARTGPRGSRVKLIDFGLVKPLDQGLAQFTTEGTAGRLIGTAHFASPEQFQPGARIDARADFYSLGATLWSALTGLPPSGGQVDMERWHRGSEPPWERIATLPDAVQTLLRRLLAKDRELRPRDAGQLLAEWEATIAATAGPPAPPQSGVATPPHSIGPQPRRAVRWKVAAGALVVGLAIAGVWKQQHPSGSGGDSTPTPAPDAVPTLLADATAALAATKDAPFENSLGMKFVPVPITGGPTDGKRVLFCIWETRVKDYAEFAKEDTRPKKDTSWKDCEFKGEKQEPTHPVVNVSWEDADAFCRWLTKREHDAGRAPKDWQYRLPSDHEWSCAIGIGDQEKAKATRPPREKHGTLPGVYPWGRAETPPPRFGNFLGSEAKKFGFLGFENYADADAFTAPVDSPKYYADANGLLHLAGNVWEWCDDWYDGEQKYRVLRGGSWFNGDLVDLSPSIRINNDPDLRDYYFGFRLVWVGASAR